MNVPISSSVKGWGTGTCGASPPPVSLEKVAQAYGRRVELGFV